MRNLARRRDRPMSRKQKIWSIALGAVLGPASVCLVLDHIFQIRESLSGRTSAYARATGEVKRDRELEGEIRYRIAILSRPRDTNAGIGADPSARLIEAGLLYGRLALLQEAHGDLDASRSSMEQGIALLRAAGHADPTEAHIRQAVARQDSGAGRGK